MVRPKSTPKQARIQREIISEKLFYLAALRPRQWTKNLVVFAAPLFAFNLTWQSILGCLLALVLFCCASSGFYIINDIIDVESDRQHPIKCKRPIAAGLISIPAAIAISIVLLGGALSISWLRSPALGITLTSYVFLQIAYNLKLHQWISLNSSHGSKAVA